MTYKDNDFMLSSNLTSLMTKLNKSLKTLIDPSKKTLVLVDNVNIIMNGSYSGSRTLDFIEFMNEVLGLANHPLVTVALGVNRDLLCLDESDDEEKIVVEFYRELKNSAAITHIFEVVRNVSGYTKDVHGQLNIITNS